MKRYNNSRYRHRPQKRKKRIRINKVRFTIFIFCCSAILFLAGFGIKALLTDRVDLTISMTDDLNPVEGESLYRVLLSWEPLEVDDYKEVQITVDEKEYNLTPSSTQFEVDLTEPEQSYEITFKAKKKGLVFSRQLKKVVKTFEDNQYFLRTSLILKLIRINYHLSISFKKIQIFRLNQNQFPMKLLMSSIIFTLRQPLRFLKRIQKSLGKKLLFHLVNLKKVQRFQLI